LRFQVLSVIYSRISDLLAGLEEVPADVGVQLGQVRGVRVGDDEDVAGVDGLNVYKGGAVFVLVEEAGGSSLARILQKLQAVMRLPVRFQRV
jgi:hypothetical protein